MQRKSREAGLDGTASTVRCAVPDSVCTVPAHSLCLLSLSSQSAQAVQELQLEATALAEQLEIQKMHSDKTEHELTRSRSQTQLLQELTAAQTNTLQELTTTQTNIDSEEMAWLRAKVASTVLCCAASMADCIVCCTATLVHLTYRAPR